MFLFVVNLKKNQLDDVNANRILNLCSYRSKQISDLNAQVNDLRGKL